MKEIIEVFHRQIAVTWANEFSAMIPRSISRKPVANLAFTDVNVKLEFFVLMSTTFDFM